MDDIRQDITFRAATHEDLEPVASLLRAAGLPVDDLQAGMLAIAAEAKGRLVAAVGLETLGSVGLLRSLVVANEYRNAKLGKELVIRLEDRSRQIGLDELWLLTIDADAWFEKLGYETVGREQAPVAIRETAEFSSLCPGDAALMRKHL